MPGKAGAHRFQPALTLARPGRRFRPRSGAGQTSQAKDCSGGDCRFPTSPRRNPNAQEPRGLGRADVEAVTRLF